MFTVISSHLFAIFAGDQMLARSKTLRNQSDERGVNVSIAGFYMLWRQS